MGFPVGYTEVFMPRVFVHFLSILGFIRSMIISLFTHLGLSDFLETDISVPNQPLSSDATQYSTSRSASLIRELLPVVKFEELSASMEVADRLPENCAVCLHEFESEDEIRWLRNCKHIFHKTCIDRWMDHDRDTCPLCRNSFVPDELKAEFERRLWSGLYAADGDYVDELYNCEFGPVSVL